MKFLLNNSNKFRVFFQVIFKFSSSIIYFSPNSYIPTIHNFLKILPRDKRKKIHPQNEVIPSKKGEKTGPIGGGYGLVPVKTIISSAESYYTRVLCRKLWRVFITERMETCRLGSRHSVESRYSPVTKFLRRANDPCVPIPLPPPTHTHACGSTSARDRL